MDMDIQDKKIELIQWLSTLDDKSIIEKIMKLRESEKVDWWENISNQEKKSIEQGMEDAASGRMKPHSEAKKLYGKWL
ncbi:hypothetical protein D2V93_09305 [Flagellimonas taeanensis]|jgi:predicted transcriptional regulator|uniref:Addiction module component n=1 Tax=Flagellimonas taeanensis TaxID=1005926 RepID=A0A1M6V9E0_9FLAO|nr:MULTISPECIES: hypothetical protein [Allomuricauda]MDC6385666.1 hypothetical protein [Muricauda sp. SK9]MEE1963267.1 hypothetical protein [Allomuricauda taeanensis]RIV51040.1 hypothetical protein D2V93_09305 [Allomuricauda taeanensis]SFC19566.1 hypothetical protein SAMN04487891_10764 [Allomuricauda taeanensis]SHK77974.1 hypothetical protein SAMN05216293_1943 [Allomuricauda taeanensis]